MPADFILISDAETIVQRFHPGILDMHAISRQETIGVRCAVAAQWNHATDMRLAKDVGGIVIMNRDTVGRYELLDMIGAQLRSMDICSDMAVTIERDDSRCTGANWRATYAKRPGSDKDQTPCGEAIAGFMGELADRYDVPERAATSDEIKTWIKQIPSRSCPVNATTEPVPALVLDSLLDAQFVEIVDGKPERTGRGEQVAVG
ncbi:MAG: hypothetical protein ABI881_15345 [Betaproteobacteria bacterium]